MYYLHTYICMNVISLESHYNVKYTSMYYIQNGHYSEGCTYRENVLKKNGRRWPVLYKSNLIIFVEDEGKFY